MPNPSTIAAEEEGNTSPSPTLMPCGHSTHAQCERVGDSAQAQAMAAAAHRFLVASRVILMVPVLTDEVIEEAAEAECELENRLIAAGFEDLK